MMLSSYADEGFIALCSVHAPLRSSALCEGDGQLPRVGDELNHTETVVTRLRHSLYDTTSPRAASACATP